MNNNILLRNRLVRENYDFSVVNGYSYNQKEKKLNKIHQDLICEYLINPVKNGFWSLKLDWRFNGEIIEDLIDENKNVFYKDNGNKKTDIDNKELLKEISTISFIFELFNKLCRSKTSIGEEKSSLFSKYEYDNILLKTLELTAFKEKYRVAINFFEENIFCDDLDLRIVSDEVLIIKDGYFITPTLDEDDFRIKKLRDEDVGISRKITFISTDFSTLKKVLDFFILIKKVDLFSKICRIFSPEEELFRPYTIFLTKECKYAIQDKGLVNRFEKSLDEFKDGDYSHSIGTIGLAAEDILSQVFETLFREWLPKQYTLGQTLDSIDAKVNSLYKEQQDKEPDSDYLYETTKHLIKKGEKVTKKEILEFNREIINYSITVSKYQKNKINNILKKDNVKSIFPTDLKENITELIRYRNSISHISRNPIGKYEATRSIFTCFKLYKWWVDTTQNIDWIKTPEEIIKSLVRE